MNAKNLLLFFFLLVTAIAMGQRKKSNGDVRFFEYDYKGAIREYVKEMKDQPLTDQQTLNLADSYLKEEIFDKASDTYLQVFEKNNELAPYYFNRLLQAISQTEGRERTRVFMNEHNNGLSALLLENAEFNFQVLQDDDNNTPNVTVFNVNGNSPQTDFAPSFYKDQVLFTSSRSQADKKIYEPSGESYLDIFVAAIDNKGDFLTTRPFNGIPNSEYHQGTPFYSDTLDVLFYVRTNEQAGELVFDENGKNTLALGSADKSGEFRFLLKDTSTSFYYPFYDADSGKLYFAANFGDGLGGTDIYYVYTNNGLIMSSPINLGPRVNGPGNEIAPYIFEGSLYFSSDVFYGYGGMDIYRSEIKEDGIFSIPVNLGKGLNSEKDDFGYIIKNYRENSLLGYFSSNREGGKGKDDIYGFIVMEKPGIKTVTLYGSVINLTTNNTIPEAEVRLLDKEGKLLKEVKTDEKGAFRVEVPMQEAITVQATKERHSVFSDTYPAEALGQIQESAFNMGIARVDDLVEEKEGQTVLKLQKFYFDKGKSIITPEIALELDKVVDAVARFPQMQLRIESHTDSRGGGATNFRISQNRADAIKDYLESHGVSTSNILYSIGYGEDKLINDCTDGVFCLDTFHKQNERQLIVVLNYDLLF